METETILQNVETYLDEKRDQNFTQVFSHELLKIIFESIGNAQKKHPEFNFTPEYKVDVALLVCGYALPMFEQMEEHFRNKNDPVEFLNEKKTPYLRNLKSLYYQTAQEKTAADNLYDCFINPIEEALKGLLTQRIAGDVRSSSNSFSTKKTLKARILTDLADKQCFEEYALYLKDVKDSVRTWLVRYTKQHCEECRGKKSRFTELAEVELERLVALISKAANKVTDSFRQTDIQQWLDRFHSEVMTDLSLNLSEMQKVVGDLKDIRNFTEELCKKLADLDMNQFPSLYDDMETWDNQPYDILMNVLSGCCEQCPFCKEQCELTDPNHSSKHSVSLHRSQCLGGWRWNKSQKMVLETCTALVASYTSFRYKDNGQWKSHPYSRFQEVPKYSFWTISSGSSQDDKLCIYWKWFLGEYTGDVAQLYNMKEENIPWKRFTLEEAKLDIKKLYGT